MQDHFITDRLSLSLVTESDSMFIKKLLNTEGWIRFIGQKNIHSEEDAINYIQKIQSTVNLSYWVVSLKEDLQPIGIISLLKRDYLEHFDIGFAFLPESYGNGYAFEAANIILKNALTTDVHKKILAVTLPNNISSIGLLKKLGMSFEKDISNGSETLQLFTT